VYFLNSSRYRFNINFKPLLEMHAFVYLRQVAPSSRTSLYLLAWTSFSALYHFLFLIFYRRASFQHCESPYQLYFSEQRKRLWSLLLGNNRFGVAAGLKSTRTRPVTYKGSSMPCLSLRLSQCIGADISSEICLLSNQQDGFDFAHKSIDST
jgi:hypothetical protein